MPIHDWTRLEAGDFHDFRLGWVVGICGALNGGLLPADYMAMAERVTPDAREPEGEPGGVAVATASLTARVIAKFERIHYAKRADRVVIRHGRGKVVAVIEVVSRGTRTAATRSDPSWRRRPTS